MSKGREFSCGPVTCIKATDKALLVEPMAGNPILSEETWVPLSVIHDDSEVFDGEENAEGELFVVEWFAVKQGWV